MLAKLNEDETNTKRWEITTYKCFLEFLEMCNFDVCPGAGSETFFSKYTEQEMKFSIKDFFSKCDQIRWKLRIWSHLLKKSLMQNFIFGAVIVVLKLYSASLKEVCEGFQFLVKLQTVHQQHYQNWTPLWVLRKDSDPKHSFRYI